MRIEGLVSISHGQTSDGKIISAKKAIEYGFIKPAKIRPSGWDLSDDEVVLNYNLSMDNLRQYNAYLFGGRTPAVSYVCSAFGIGTGTSAPNVTDTDLNSPLLFYKPSSTLLALKPIDSVDYPSPFMARVQYTISTGDISNPNVAGALITEIGMYAVDSGSGAGTLLARETSTGFPLQSDFGPTLLWRFRF